MVVEFHKQSEKVHESNYKCFLSVCVIFALVSLVKASHIVSHGPKLQLLVREATL